MHANTTTKRKWGIEMLKFFKRNRPQHRAVTAPPVILAPADQIIAAYHRLTPAQFAALPALVQRDMREHVAWEARSAS